jgi:hypothetical protein
MLMEKDRLLLQIMAHLLGVPKAGGGKESTPHTPLQKDPTTMAAKARAKKGGGGQRAPMALGLGQLNPGTTSALLRLRPTAIMTMNFGTPLCGVGLFRSSCPGFFGRPLNSRLPLGF